MRWYAKVALALIVLAVAALGYAAWVVKSQELSADFWSDYPTAKVRFDAEGIPTIEGADWGAVVTAQGFVVASERLWQSVVRTGHRLGRT